jgi:DNA-binding transcriptional regulator YdaS (Cro superfamily)
MTQVEFAKKIGTKKAQVCDVLKGRSYFGRLRRLKIVKVTGGEITLADLDTFKRPKVRKKKGRRK